MINNIIPLTQIRVLHGCPGSHESVSYMDAPAHMNLCPTWMHRLTRIRVLHGCTGSHESVSYMDAPAHTNPCPTWMHRLSGSNWAQYTLTNCVSTFYNFVSNLVSLLSLLLCHRFLPDTVICTYLEYAAEYAQKQFMNG